MAGYRVLVFPYDLKRESLVVLVLSCSFVMESCINADRALKRALARARSLVKSSMAYRNSFQDGHFIVVAMASH